MARRQSTQEEDDAILNDPSEFLASKSKTYLQLNYKFDTLKLSITQVYQQLINQCLDFRQVNVPASMNLIPMDKKGHYEPLAVLAQMQSVMDICVQASKQVCTQLTSRDQALEGQYDETLIRLEREIRQLLRSEEKLKVYIECAQLRINEMKTREKELEDEILTGKVTKQSTLALANQQKKTSFKKRNESVDEVVDETHQSTKIKLQVVPKSAASYSQANLSNVQTSNVEHVRSGSRLIMSAVSRLPTQQSGQISQQILLSNENAKLKNQVRTAYKGKDMEQQKLSFELRRMAIRVEDLEQENRYLRKEISEVSVQLTKKKDEKSEQEKQRWHLEAVSDANPYLVDHYRKKMEEKDKVILGLSKNIKQAAVVEKKLLDKEKAFEVERAENQEKLLYLNERVSNISKELGSHKRQVQNRNTRTYQPHEDN